MCRVVWHADRSAWACVRDGRQAARLSWLCMLCVRRKSSQLGPGARSAWPSWVLGRWGETKAEVCRLGKQLVRKGCCGTRQAACWGRRHTGHNIVRSSARGPRRGGALELAGHAVRDGVLRAGGCSSGARCAALVAGQDGWGARALAGCASEWRGRHVRQAPCGVDGRARTTAGSMARACAAACGTGGTRGSWG